MIALGETCMLCAAPFGDAGRYIGDGGSGVFQICDTCGERIADLRTRDPHGGELDALLDQLLLAAAAPEGTA